MTAESTEPADSPVGHGSKRRLWPKAIAALLSASNFSKAAKLAGVSRETLGRWQHDPEFRAALDVARREIVSGAILRLQAATTDAVDALHRCLASRAPTVQLSAARTILEYALKAKELEDIEARLAALEQRANLADGRTRR